MRAIKWRGRIRNGNSRGKLGEKSGARAKPLVSCLVSVDTAFRKYYNEKKNGVSADTTTDPALFTVHIRL